MNIEKINALKSVILKISAYEHLPDVVPERKLVDFFKDHSLLLTCSTLRRWLSGEEEPSDEILMDLMERNCWRATPWSGRNP